MNYTATRGLIDYDDQRGEYARKKVTLVNLTKILEASSSWRWRTDAFINEHAPAWTPNQWSKARLLAIGWGLVVSVDVADFSHNFKAGSNTEINIWGLDDFQ